jgi:cyclopropane-fatty-acyl-phospholipid synthase
MNIERFIPRIEAMHRTLVARGEGVDFALETPEGRRFVFGGGEPAFVLSARTRAGLRALMSTDLPTIAEAYVHGDLEVEGDLTKAMLIRTLVSDHHPLRFLWRLLRPRAVGQIRSDRQAIARHYDYDQDFYLLFLDGRHRCYSQGIFARDDEPLEDAMTRKLDFALEAVGAGPGDRVLDIGGGWGAFAQHAGRRGIRVTSLTLSVESEAFLNTLIAREGLPGRVHREHFLEHAPNERYDAIVNLGVTEHLPDYRATLRQYLALLKPGGRIYLDASATREKNDHSTFLARSIYPGNGSLLCLHEYLAELARTPLQLEGVYDDRHSYHLTARAWAERLDRHREEVERRWGPELYRKFRLYLWGCADAFQRDLIQAYRMVLHLPPRPSPKMRLRLDVSKVGLPEATAVG